MYKSQSLEANSSSDSKEIPHLSWSLKVHYRIHKRLPSVYIPSRSNPFHVSQFHFLNIVLILSCHLRLGFQVVPFPQFTPLNPECISPYPMHATRAAHLILLNLITRIIILYLLWCTKHEVPLYVVFSTRLLSCPS
jgi:hypothetical protein